LDNTGFIVFLSSGHYQVPDYDRSDPRDEDIPYMQKNFSSQILKFAVVDPEWFFSGSGSFFQVGPVPDPDPTLCKLGQLNNWKILSVAAAKLFFYLFFFSIFLRKSVLVLFREL